jgi:AP-1-like factor
METFANHNPVWDLSQPSSFSELPDDDFLALLQKQFPTSNDAHFQSGAVYTNGVNPQSVSRYSLPTMTPPSEDSDASTPNTNNNESNIRINESDDPVLKRKASEDDFDDEGPSQKNQHTCTCNFHNYIHHIMPFS